ncbi:MAG: 3-deoxy-manno-octulosonate cytidylyltransferase [Opitutaceae bacterium]|nr:3-deoxy-manno-octulosonate cytidylyltransferase [Opitutaceae bacterium]
MPTTAIIVPCRLESTRFPRKLLHRVKGKALLQWVAERITTAAPEFPLYFAIDDDRLREPLAAGGFQTILTSASHASGTDRIAEANRTVKADFVVNVQADEPLVSRSQILTLAEAIQSDAPMATLATPFRTSADFANPNQVKVVLARASRRALFFSRSPLPFARDLGGRVDDAWVRSHPCYRHLGLYAYQADLLEKFAKLPLGQLEQIERLEQLRVLENGFPITCDLTDDPTIGVDTLEDAVKFEALLG